MFAPFVMPARVERLERQEASKEMALINDFYCRSGMSTQVFKGAIIFVLLDGLS